MAMSGAKSPQISRENREKMFAKVKPPHQTPDYYSHASLLANDLCVQAHYV